MDNLFVGGEFYEDHRWVSDTPVNVPDNQYFLNGGRACLRVICNYLTTNHQERVLLPSYLCPSIMDIFGKFGLQFHFYNVNKDLSLDLQDIEEKSRSVDAIYFINYFGFQHKTVTIEFLKDLQFTGKILIEDNAHGGFLHPKIGDLSFCSMRKLCAYDGGYLATRKINLAPLLSPNTPTNLRLPIIREYRRRLRRYLLLGLGKRADLEKLFYQAENYYEMDQVMAGDPLEKHSIESLDWQAIKLVRRANYAYLLERIATIPQLEPIFPTLSPQIMPIGLPVYIRGVSRHALLANLADASISLTVHWEELATDPRVKHLPSIKEMADSMVTLPIDQYTNEQQLDYLVTKLKVQIARLNR